MSKKIARRQSIIQAAIEVFGKGSVRNSSISEIARRANVADGTIYQYFRNKEDLFFAFPLRRRKSFVNSLIYTSRGSQELPIKSENSYGTISTFSK
jgi:TetR/AcrR family fatty acid metabolism transcriptional regulator